MMRREEVGLDETTKQGYYNHRCGSGMAGQMALLFAKEGLKLLYHDINLENLNKVVTEITLDGGIATL